MEYAPIAICMLALGRTNGNAGSKEHRPLFHLENDLGSGFAAAPQGSGRSPIELYVIGRPLTDEGHASVDCQG
jgi:hypothetical protein